MQTIGTIDIYIKKLALTPGKIYKYASSSTAPMMARGQRDVGNRGRKAVETYNRPIRGRS